MIDITQSTKRLFIKEFDTKFNNDYSHAVLNVNDDIRIIERTQLLDTRFQYVIMKSDDNSKDISYDDFLGLLFFSLIFDDKLMGDPLEKWIYERNGVCLDTRK